MIWESIMLDLLCRFWRMVQRSCLILLLLSPTLALAQRSERASAPASDTAAITAHEIAYFEFIAAAPFTAEERQQLTRDTAAAVQAEPARMNARDHDITALLAHLPTWRPGQAEMERAGRRQNLPVVNPADIEPLASTERRAVNAHDPVVLYDAPGKRLVTERSLVLLCDAAAWTAQEIGLPGPDGTFTNKARQSIRSHFLELDPVIANGLAHMDQYAHDEPYVLATLKPDKLAEFKTKARADFAALPASTDKQWWLAISTAKLVEQVKNIRSLIALQAWNIVNFGQQRMMTSILNTQKRNIGNSMRGQPLEPFSP